MQTPSEPIWLSVAAPVMAAGVGAYVSNVLSGRRARIERLNRQDETRHRLDQVRDRKIRELQTAVARLGRRPKRRGTP